MLCYARLYKAILRDKKVCSEFYLYIYREIKIFIDKKHYTRRQGIFGGRQGISRWRRGIFRWSKNLKVLGINRGDTKDS
jgi:hypothetical protein